MAGEDAAEQRFQWAFGQGGSCREVGYVTAVPLPCVAAWPSGRRLRHAEGCSSERFDVMDLGVTSSAAGLPLGSLSDQVYRIGHDAASGHRTVMRLDPTTGAVTFEGKNVKQDDFWVLTPVDGGAAVQLRPNGWGNAVVESGWADVPTHNCSGLLSVTSTKVPKADMRFRHKLFQATRDVLVGRHPTQLVVTVLVAVGALAFGALICVRAWREEAQESGGFTAVGSTSVAEQLLLE